MAILSRERIVEAASRIVDEGGLDALTTRRLADELGVKGASLYNHFANKEELVFAVAEHNFVHEPKFFKGDPIRNIVVGARQLRDNLMAHPDLLPVMVQQHSTGLAHAMLDKVAQQFVADGIPLESIIDIFETMEQLAIGSALRELSEGDKWDPDTEMVSRYPTLAAAALARKMDRDKRFEIAASGVVEAILNSHQGGSSRGAISTNGRAKVAELAGARSGPGRNTAAKSSDSKRR